MSKKSIRFFNDREVRAVWDEENSKWWFSATDIVRAINNEDDYVKAGNYWRWLKKKLNTDGIQLVSITHDFKFTKKPLERVLKGRNFNIQIYQLIVTGRSETLNCSWYY